MADQHVIVAPVAAPEPMTPEQAAAAIILKDGDPRLSRRCQAWQGAPHEARELAELLNRTMRLAGGVGLAAPQVGVLRRVFCIMLDAELSLCCFNPSIGVRMGARVKRREGCLSFPGVFLEIWRSEGVTVRFMSMTGAMIERELWGREAHAFQHELDHLDGRCLPDMVPAHVWERERLAAAARG